MLVGLGDVRSLWLRSCSASSALWLLASRVSGVARVELVVGELRS